MHRVERVVEIERYAPGNPGRVNLYGAHFPRVRARGTPTDRFAANADDDVVAAAAGRAVQLRGDRKQAALKDQRYRPPVDLCRSESSRVREGRAEESDPLAPPGRRCGCWPPSMATMGATHPKTERGERWSSGVRGER
jgi:hypothetical protein